MYIHMYSYKYASYLNVALRDLETGNGFML